MSAIQGGVSYVVKESDTKHHRPCNHHHSFPSELLVTAITASLALARLAEGCSQDPQSYGQCTQ
jgi:hypothetical protein